MHILVPITLLGWIPFVLLLFAFMRSARRAVIVAFLLAWLFLPVYGYSLPGLPNYTKMTATCFGVLLGMLLVDFGVFWRIRPHWVDLPMALWCICPAIASMTNGLGAYDALSAFAQHAIIFGLPYLIGRAYFSTLPAIRELAIAMFIGGLIYVPLCLYEIRMSPQLNMIVYGFYQSPFAMTHRLGGFRPVVFMEHGLMVGMWMCMTAMIGWWLWRRGRLTRLGSVPTGFLVVPLIGTAVLCRSLGAIMLLILGLGVLTVVRLTRAKLAVALLLMLPIGYVAVRTNGLWTGDDAVAAISRFSPARAGSLGFRLSNEDKLIVKALERPVFGWSRWGRSRVYNERGHDISTTDGLWIIALGQNGFVGLASLLGFLLLPGFVLVWKLPRHLWLHPAWAAPVVLAVMLGLHTIDSLMNAMDAPIFVLAAGGLTGIAAALVKPRVAAIQKRAATVRERQATFAKLTLSHSFTDTAHSRGASPGAPLQSRLVQK